MFPTTDGTCTLQESWAPGQTVVLLLCLQQPAHQAIPAQYKSILCCNAVVWAHRSTLLCNTSLCAPKTNVSMDFDVQALQTCTRFLASSWCGGAPPCRWLAGSAVWSSSPHLENMRFSFSFYSIMCALTLATLENFWQTRQVRYAPLCMHLWNVRLTSILNVSGHWSHRFTMPFTSWSVM